MIKNKFNPRFKKILISLIIANLLALFWFLNLAKEIEDIASNPIIHANHTTYSGFVLNSINLAILSEYILHIKIKREDVKINENKQVE